MPHRRAPDRSAQKNCFMSRIASRQPWNSVQGFHLPKHLPWSRRGPHVGTFFLLPFLCSSSRAGNGVLRSER